MFFIESPESFSFREGAFSIQIPKRFWKYVTLNVLLKQTLGEAGSISFKFNLVRYRLTVFKYHLHLNFSLSNW